MPQRPILIGTRSKFIVVLGLLDDEMYYEIALRAGAQIVSIESEARKLESFGDVVDHMSASGTCWHDVADAAIPFVSLQGYEEQQIGRLNTASTVSVSRLPRNAGYIVHEHRSADTIVTGNRFARTAAGVWALLDSPRYKSVSFADPAALRRILI